MHKLIVAFTSYQARIKYCSKVIKSLLNQTISKELYKIILVLAVPNFPNKEKDLPTDLLEIVNNNDNVEILWYDKDIRSHKKLIPVLKKYPDTPILLTDDDILRNKLWIQTFYNDHIKYPNDVIIGSSFDTVDRKMNFDSGRLQQGKIHMTITPGIIFNFSRPANGLGGTLYPANTFSDPRFFDEDLMMKECESDDELWQWCFNIIEGKTIRQVSKSYNIEVIKEAQHISLHNENIVKTPKYFKRLLTIFPEFKEKLEQNQNKIILSIGFDISYLEYLIKSIQSMLHQSKTIDKKCITIYRQDYIQIEDKIIKFLKDHDIEIIVVDNDFKEYNKLYYPMVKYPNYAVIALNANMLYKYGYISQMFDMYLKYPYSIIAYRCSAIGFNRRKVTPYKAWAFDYPMSSFPAYNLVADPFAGILYPANSLGINQDFTRVIKSFIGYEELYLKYIENIRSVPTFSIGNHSNYQYLGKMDTKKYKIFLYKDRCQQYYDMYQILNNTKYKSEFNVDKKFTSEFNDKIKYIR